jgi:acetyl-CoA acyltransferase
VEVSDQWRSFVDVNRAFSEGVSGDPRSGIADSSSNSVEGVHDMREAVIVDAVRSPLGKGRAGGWLSCEHPADVLTLVLLGLIERTGIDPSLVEDVIAGCVNAVGEQSDNIARTALLAAGFPEHVPGTTLDRKCGSSQQAAHFAAQGVIAGAYDVAIACGVEIMSRVPMGTSRMGADTRGRLFAQRYPEGLVKQGISAELIASRWGISREEMDTLSVESHRRAAAATESGAFKLEIIPLPGCPGGAAVDVNRDEGIRAQTSIEVLAGLKPAFQSDDMAERFPEIRWSVTAGNSSQISDGAAAALIMERGVAERLGLRPRARFVAFSVVGDDPILMLTGVIPATRQVLERARLSVSDIDLFEVNEAFASVVLAWQRDLKTDLDRTNIHGGAIALGHPLGASGCRILATLTNALEQRGARYGLQVMCEAGGMANAMVLERL